MTRQTGLGGIRVVKVTNAGQMIGINALRKVLAKVPSTGFIALDAEFSGLGPLRTRKQEDLLSHYCEFRDLAHTRALFSVGVAVFIPSDFEPSQTTHGHSPKSNTPSRLQTYEVASFDFVTRCEDSFSMDCSAGKFLVENGFDFRHMFLNGISYARAGSRNEARIRKTQYSLRNLLTQLGRTGAPIIVHNGILDLAFLCAAFHGPLPTFPDQFATQLLRWVPGGFWDTKHISRTILRQESSLESLFGRLGRKDLVNVRNYDDLPDNILTDISIFNSCVDDKVDRVYAAHDSGWDAFCTGYIFAAYRSSIPPEQLEDMRNRLAFKAHDNGWFLKHCQVAR